jgi:hypothetical protein
LIYHRIVRMLKPIETASVAEQAYEALEAAMCVASSVLGRC